MVLSAIPGACFSDTDFKAALLVSKKIKPYIHVVDGITDEIAETPMDVFFLSASTDDESRQLNLQIADQLQGGQYDLVTAIGPEAASVLWDSKAGFKKMYAAVLDPDALPALSSQACGISLRIPAQTQLEKIAHTFQTIRKIGLIFDPGHNQWFYDQALSAAADKGLEIIPLSVASKNQIAGVLKDHMGAMDAVWMIPDPTVISEKIIHYVIKQGLYNKRGVIGYNSFFTRSGAFFSFEFDYRALGRQAGQEMNTYLETGECRQIPPVFNTIVNEKIADKIGIRVTR